ncbi:hypothetical protein PtB15_7B345 [Puccinia triticina]|nr:hypothetical protein PtB15_7B345 [Puccinia triticina]
MSQTSFDSEKSELNAGTDEGTVGGTQQQLERLIRLCKQLELGQRGLTKETRLIFKAVDGFGQQIALKTVVQQEQKKWLNQQNLGLFWEPTQPTDPAVANTIPAL